MKKVIWLLGAVLVVLLLTSALSFRGEDVGLSLDDLDVEMEEVLAKPQRRPKLEVKAFEGRVTSIGERSIVVEDDEFIGELIAIGKWLLISSEDAGVYSWSDVKGYVNEGDAFIVMVVVSRGNKTFNILLALKQSNTILIRPIALRYYAKGHKHTRLYMSIYCKVVGRRGPYLVIEKNGVTGLLMADPNSKWYKAGHEETTWSGIVNEFKEGDLIRVFYHNVLVFKDEFREKFGIGFVIWSYSGAIIDLTTGLAITKVG